MLVILSTYFSTVIPQTTNTFVLTVHYGSPAPTRRLVDQLLENTRRPDQIVLVDHGGAGPVLPTSHPRVRVITQKNRGYMAGLATGFAAVRDELRPQDIVICLNNDVSVGPRVIEDVVTWMNQHKEPVLAGIIMGHVNMLTGRAYLRSAPHVVFTLPYVHGSFFTARADVFARLTLPTDMFLYWEDVVLSWNALKAGVSLKTLPDMGIHHLDEHVPASEEKLYYLVRNGAQTLMRRSPGGWSTYWQIVNPARLWYHRQAGHTVIANALRDAMKKEVISNW